VNQKTNKTSSKEEILLLADFLGYNYVGNNERETYEKLRENEKEKMSKLQITHIGGDFVPGWYSSKVWPFKSPFFKKTQYPVNYIMRPKWFLNFNNWELLDILIDKLNHECGAFIVFKAKTNGSSVCTFIDAEGRIITKIVGKKRKDVIYEAIVETVKFINDGK